MRQIYKNILKKYIRETSGAIMIAFALMAPVVIGAAGMAVDYAQSYLVQQRLAQAIDSAALAAAASSTDPDEIELKVKDFFNTNYPPEKLGATFDPEVTVVDGEIRVGGRAIYYTVFLSLLGIDTIDILADTVVQREVRGLEVVMVLDNTGSMSTNNNIGALRDATRNFINILFNRVTDPEDIKIGLVPYANAVRVGQYGLGLRPDGTAYETPFVTLPAGVTYTNTHMPNNANRWYGCVIEHNARGWNPAVTNNDPYPNDVLDQYQGPWQPYLYETFGANAACGQTCTTRNGRTTCTNNSCYIRSNQPNTNCPVASILPMTSNKTALLNHVNTMTAHGNTLGNIGMVWGYRMISPEAPFTEGVAWDNQNWRKAVIMMTDGENTRDTHYSAFWRARNNAITVTRYNQRFVETCEALKEQDVLVYTVTFYSNISESTKAYYRDCASSPDHYYDAPTQEELISVFEEISRELSNIYISE